MCKRGGIDRDYMVSQCASVRRSVLIMRTGTCTMRNGDSCSSFGIWVSHTHCCRFMPGLMLATLAGVPLSYCHCTLYLANHAPSVYKWNRFALAALYTSYLFAYWVWDTANSQKNAYRHSERGTLQDRQTFPQLPWKHVKNPTVIETDTGDSILVDGWCMFAFFQHCDEQSSHLSRWTCSKNTLYGRCRYQLAESMQSADHSSSSILL